MNTHSSLKVFKIAKRSPGCVCLLYEAGSAVISAKGNATLCPFSCACIIFCGDKSILEVLEVRWFSEPIRGVSAWPLHNPRRRALCIVLSLFLNKWKTETWKRKGKWRDRGEESQEVMTKIKQTAQFREGRPNPLDAYYFLYLHMVSVSVISFVLVRPCCLCVCMCVSGVCLCVCERKTKSSLYE